MRCLVKVIAVVVGLTSPRILADTILRLGDTQRVADLFSYPNNCSTVCYRPWTLQQTVDHYLAASLKRDGYTSSSLDIYSKDNIYYAKITGDNLDAFIDRYGAFLTLGDKAISLARDVNSKGKWRYDWRFMLPLGLPMANNWTLEVMDFPPVSLLLETQDYLVSNTTNRWKALLVKNGVATKDLEFYGAILDIVPIAAPAGDGKKLEEAGVYNGSFNDYALPMLALWTKPASGIKSKPIMALGAPMREWFKNNFKISLNILEVNELTLTDGRKVAIMGSNHPSYFFYAANKYTTGINKEELNFALGLELMKQDIVAACWQTEMGKNSGFDPRIVKENCTTRWRNRDRELCTLVEVQAYKKTETAAETRCQQRKYPSKFVPSVREMMELELAARFN